MYTPEPLSYKDSDKKALYLRDLEIFYMRKWGATLQSIGDTYDITKERVRQVVGRIDRMLDHKVNRINSDIPINTGLSTMDYFDPMKVQQYKSTHRRKIAPNHYLIRIAPGRVGKFASEGEIQRKEEWNKTRGYRTINL